MYSTTFKSYNFKKRHPTTALVGPTAQSLPFDPDLSPGVGSVAAAAVAGTATITDRAK